MDTLVIMFECDPRGVLVTGARVWSDKDWAAAIGGNADITLGCIRELVGNGVIKCRGNETQAFAFKHADSIEGIPAGAFYSFRLVADEIGRQNNRERQATFKKRLSNAASNGGVTAIQRRSSSSSSTSPSGIEDQTNTTGTSTAPSLETVVEFGAMRGLQKADCEQFWHHFESAGWIDKNGHPVLKWQSKLMTWKTNAQQERHIKNGDGKPKFWESKAKLDIIESEIKAIEGRASHTAMDVLIQPQDKDRYAKLRKERREIKKAIGIT
jgi:hypothetical protein